MAEELKGYEFELPVIELEEKINELKKTTGRVDISAELKALEEKCNKLKAEIYGSLTPIQIVQLARHPKRPYTLDYVNMLFKDFIELHGDRCFGDDKAVVCGVGYFNSISVVIIGHQKGRLVQENIDRNFGMMNPEGYRKAFRVMKLAERFAKPVIIFIDTPGAYPGIGAEERGQAEAIARNLREMFSLKTPTIGVVIGEGGSGGALGIGVVSRLLMLENAYYSVISPEGCAAILFRDATKSAEAASALKLTSRDLYRLGIVDEIIPEPLGGAHRDISQTAENIRHSLIRHLSELSKISYKKLLEMRYEKYRKISFFTTIKRGEEKNVSND